MKGTRTVVVATLTCGAILVFAVGQRGAIAAKPRSADKVDPAREEVEQVLAREATSQVSRRAELAKTLIANPDSNSVRWQSGFVQEGSGWRSFDEPALAPAAAAKLTEYRGRRGWAKATRSGQMELANWCRANGLPDQERAHLFAALNAAPDTDNSGLLQRLGYRRWGSEWFSRDQLRQWQEVNRRALASVTRLRPQLEKIARQLQGTARQRELGLGNLREFAQPETIPAVEYILCARGEKPTHDALDAFERMPEYEATLALAKQAIFSDVVSVRKHAARALKSRKFEEFVPALVSLLMTPLQTTLVASPDEQGAGNQPLSVERLTPEFNGDQAILRYTYVVARETENQFQVSALHTTDYRLTELLARDSVSTNTNGGIGNDDFDRSAIRRDLNDINRAIAAEATERQKQIDVQNRRTQQLNERIAQVLATVSAQPPDPDPQKWWSWWDAYNDTERGEKYRYRSDDYDVKGNPSVRLSEIFVPRITPTAPSVPTFQRRSECFVAGTPVWTESGLVPIEQLQPGDRVLAQNVDTGELGYKAVIATSNRAPKELVQLKVGDESLVSTGGHRYWVSGSGWIKAQDLKPEQWLHTATGNAAIASVDAGPTAETYNLVVDGFHTYFVGSSGILVQDFPIPQPTNSGVPGLSRRQFVAAIAP